MESLKLLSKNSYYDDDNDLVVTNSDAKFVLNLFLKEIKDALAELKTIEEAQEFLNQIKIK